MRNSTDPYHVTITNAEPEVDRDIYWQRVLVHGLGLHWHGAAPIARADCVGRNHADVRRNAIALALIHAGYAMMKEPHGYQGT